MRRAVLGNQLLKYKNKEKKMNRYSKSVGTKNKREIVLLKGHPCVWGRCAFCDYIEDNCISEEECFAVNSKVLDLITGDYKALEVINSGSVFELDKQTLAKIKQVCIQKNINTLYFECYYSYKDRLDEIRNYFGINIVFKCGIETFDDNFRNKVLKKGIIFDSPLDVAKYFDSICLMVGIKGQTKQSIENDINILLKYFKYGCVNVYCNNSTNIKADPILIEWFDKTYGDMLRGLDNIDYLYCNTDFGVGEL